MEDSIFVDYYNHNLPKRWVAYFDLLGFSKLVESNNWNKIIDCYEKALTQCKRQPSLKETGVTWFSDTFLFYSFDDSFESLISIEMKSRWFLYYLIWDYIPIRGALSFESFYVNEKQNVFIGKALIESYRYGEAQNWIGFIFCPSVVEKLEGSPQDFCESINYTYWDIPQKNKKDIEIQVKLPAYIIGGHSIHNGKNVCLERLKSMEQKIDNPDIKLKYKNSIEFIEKNKRIMSKTKK